MSNEEQEELKGYVSLPRSFLQALGGSHGSTYSVALFVALSTMGRQIKIGNTTYRVKHVCLSYDEFIYGRRKRDGGRMEDTSGLKDDKPVSRGIRGALAKGLIEIVETGQRGVCVYTVPDHFWAAAGFLQAILMLADSRIPDSYADYHLIDIPTAVKTTADETAETANPVSTAVKTTAVRGQNDSSEGQNDSSSAVKTTAEPSPQTTQDKARRERKHTSQDRVFKIENKIEAPDGGYVEMEKEETKTKETNPTPSRPADAPRPASTQAADVGAGPPTAEPGKVSERPEETAEEKHARYQAWRNEKRSTARRQALDFTIGQLRKEVADGQASAQRIAFLARLEQRLDVLESQGVDALEQWLQHEEG